MTLRIIQDDNRNVLRQMAESGEKVHSVVTDPPYGLVSITKRFGASDSAPAKSNGATGVFKRTSAGFLGQTWDGTQIERDPEFWRMVYDVMIPGAFCLAFSSPRTGHWQACAMEQAGFTMHPTIAWVYGQGMPKGHKIHAPGAEHLRQGAAALKPSQEPIYVAQRPFSERTATDNWKLHKVGAYNLRDCGVPRPGKIGVPGNLVHDGSDAVQALFPDRGSDHWIEPMEGMPVWKDASTAKNPSAARFFNSFPVSCWTCQDSGWIAEAHGYSPPEQVACPDCGGAGGHNPFDGLPMIYHAKATGIDRCGSPHPTVKPVGLIRWLIRLVTPPGGVVLDPFAGTGTTAQAAKEEGCQSIMIERQPEFVEDIMRRMGVVTAWDKLFQKFTETETV